MIVCDRCGEQAPPYPHPRSKVCKRCWEAAGTAYLARADQISAEHNVVLQGVMADADSLSWVYTAGMTRHDLPEIVLTSLPMNIAGHLLNELADAALQGDVSLTPGRLRWHDRDWWLLEVPDPATPHPGPLSLAYRMALGKPVRALQLVWSDTQGRYPWSPGWWEGEEDTEGKDPQPLWGPPPSEALQAGDT